jgi:hypothetical protein
VINVKEGSSEAGPSKKGPGKKNSFKGGEATERHKRPTIPQISPFER